MSSPSSSVPATDLARVLVKPTLYRGVLAVVYALFGIFWEQNPPASLLGVSSALLFLLSALFTWPLTRLTGLPSALRNALTGAALGWVVAGVIALFFREPAPLAFTLAFGLALGGICELVGGLGSRSLGRPARDMVISGGVGVLGAVILVALTLGVGDGLDVHGVYGTAAMIVVVLGVHLLLAGLGYRRDARSTAERD